LTGECCVLVGSLGRLNRLPHYHYGSIQDWTVGHIR
jgi:hypothetical protein